MRKPVIIVTLILLCATLITMENSSECESYLRKRNELLVAEKSMFFGNNLTLTTKELKVDEILLKAKMNELTASYANSSTFLPSMHFFQAKQLIDESPVFRIIKKIPKGASLHTHLVAAASVDFIINNMTYRDGLYGGYINEVFKLKFLSDPNQDDQCEWTEIKAMRKNRTAPIFDQWLKQQLIVNVNNPKEAYPNLQAIWKKFKGTFSTTYDFFSYKPVFQDYINRLLQELYDDNVMYTELKGTFMPLYDLDGKVYSKRQFFEIFIAAVDKFKRDHPKFEGVRFIHAIYRGVDEDTLRTLIDEVINMKKLFPDFIAGIDFVGFEEEGKFLVDFHQQLLEAKKQLKFFFHAGETNWFGHTDVNLADAILLESVRIGHGFALTKHPLLLNLAREKNIPLEICPISNQVLMLNDDPRNHPATQLMAIGYPLVVCNDDPSVWNASGLSYDWYVTFMAMTSRKSGLEVLKQLAKNSITYSAMGTEEKVMVMERWEQQWDEFLDEILKTH